MGKAIDYAKVLGTQTLNVLVGLTPKDVPAEKVHETLVSNLKFAAAELKKAGIPFVAEAINTRDIPGFHLTGTKQSIALFDEVARTTSSCNTTSITCRSWRVTSPPRCGR